MCFFKRWKIRSITKKLKAMQQYRLHNQPTDEALAKEIALYGKLGKIYATAGKKIPFAPLMAQACLRAAAQIESVEAQYTLARALLDEAKHREKLEQEGLFSDESNRKQTALLYAEAHGYFQRAESLGHALAKRWRGLCYINGWGVEPDKKQGFEWVLASIDQENSWDRVPQIFAEIGLNKPEFFAALGKHRGGTGV